jgi:16S rRNA (adenine1518-N6/adenine1519-N6)-dimethyltransferase
MRVEEIKAVLESLDKRPTKRLGQHFLIDESVMHRQVSFAALGPEDTVLEIGPGLGALTEVLLGTGAKVVAVEQDQAFCRFLARRFGDAIQLVQADAVKAFLPMFNKVVSNLPYQISSPITFKLLDAGFEVAVLMLQKEFAERMIAKPGTDEYGRLSVGVYYRADCEIVMNVPRRSFWPEPEVDSCVVRLTPRPPPFEVEDEEMFKRVTRALFSHRRKKIVNSLRSEPEFRELIGDSSTDEKGGIRYASKRVEELTPEMIGELSDDLVRLSRRDQGRTA